MLGKFDRKFFIDFLRDIDEAELSGILRLRQGRVLKALFFESGYMVFGISNLPDEELGQFFVNIGKISADQMSAIRTQVSKERPITHLLLHYNLVTHDELVQAEQEVVSGIALSCFRWEDGEYSFDGSRTADHEFKTQLRSLDILIEGIRRLKDSEIKQAIGELSQIIHPIMDKDYRTKRVSLDTNEIFVLSQINRTKSINILIKESGMPENEALRALYALLATGVLDPLEEALEEELESYTDFSPDRAVTAPLQARPATGPLTGPLTATPVHTVPTPPTASSPRASGAFKKLSPLDQTYSTLESAQKQATQPLPKPSERKRGKIDTAKLEALAGVKIRSYSGPREANQEEDNRAEQWFMQGKQALRTGDLRRAEALFRQSSDLIPDRAKYLLALAMLLVKRPTSKKEAEGLLIRCCELEPNAIEPRLQLAAIYEQNGMESKAEQLYKSILAIDPNHAVASQKVKKESIWKQDVGSIFSKFLKK